MSAFSAFGKKAEKAFCFPEPGALRRSVVFNSSVDLTTSNTIHTTSSIFIGLKHKEYLLIQGCYKLTLHRGECLVNGIHRISMEHSYHISSDSIDSIPTISVPESFQNVKTGQYPKVLAEYETLIEIGNVNNGISEADMFSHALMGLHQRYDNYTFKAVSVTESNNNPSILLPNDMSQALNQICHNIETVAVFGVARGGKQTFAKALINCLLLNTHNAVAYLDIDPSGANIGMPYSLSLRIFSEPLFGSFHLTHQSEYGNLEKECYFGFSHCYEMPQFYVTQCKRLIQHYQNHVQSQGIPLVVKYPSWIKGLGKDVLSSVHRFLEPKTLVYCKHENAMEIMGFKPQSFEVEHTESEMMAEFKSPQIKIVSGVRKGMLTTKEELRTRNTLLYLHQRGSHFDFRQFLIDSSPSKLDAAHVTAISVLNFDTGVKMEFKEMQFLAEASIMGIFVLPKDVRPKLRGKYLNGSDFTAMDPHFIGICVVHSVSEEFFCIYVNNEQFISDEISRALSQNKALVLARGEGQIPKVEFEAHRSSGSIPYVGDTRYALGGTWEVRKNITRKTQ